MAFLEGDALATLFLAKLRPKTNDFLLNTFNSTNVNCCKF